MFTQQLSCFSIASIGIHVLAALDQLLSLSLCVLDEELQLSVLVMSVLPSTMCSNEWIKDLYCKMFPSNTVRSPLGKVYNMCCFIKRPVN